MWQEKGFFTEENADVNSAMDELQALLGVVRAKYEGLDKQELQQAPAPGKWSKQQVLGHLTDSAINNLKRFTDAQLLEQPYNIIAYKQDGLVEVNDYQRVPLAHLLMLWQSLNQQIIFVARKIPAEKLSYKVSPQYNDGATKTLAWLICDYVAHLKHHLKTL